MDLQKKLSYNISYIKELILKHIFIYIHILVIKLHIVLQKEL